MFPASGTGPKTQSQQTSQELIKNKMAQVYFNFTVLCVDVCKTWNEDVIQLEDKICLQNCGYNRMYMHRLML